MNELSEAMVELAEEDLALPWSIVCDAWDLATSGDPTVSRTTWEECLKFAIENFKELNKKRDPKYVFNEALDLEVYTAK